MTDIRRGRTLRFIFPNKNDTMEGHLLLLGSAPTEPEERLLAELNGQWYALTPIKEPMTPGQYAELRALRQLDDEALATLGLIEKAQALKSLLTIIPPKYGER